MCFLKTLKPLQNISFEKEAVPDESSQEQNSKATKDQISYLNKLFTVPSPPILARHDQLLLTLVAQLNSNNSYLQALTQKLNQSQHRLNQNHAHLDEMMEESSQLVGSPEQSFTSIGQWSADEEGAVVDPLIVKLFGSKKYRYRLQLQDEAPTLIFKERNINISVNLVDQSSNKVMNSNIVHLCLAVCDANGQWITENRGGENFMKGKTEVEMYHGEGSFLKVYPRDVSRNYPEGKINFVIYSKPSLVQFSSSSSGVEKIADSNLIEPLLIKDVCIRAKKKE